MELRRFGYIKAGKIVMLRAARRPPGPTLMIPFWFKSLKVKVVTPGAKSVSGSGSAFTRHMLLQHMITSSTCTQIISAMTNVRL